MQNKKAFTLVEILAVIIIIGVLSLLIVPVAIGIIEDSKNKAYDMQLKNIENAARGYIAEKSTAISELENTGGTYTITLGFLIEEGYIDEPITNPKTNLNFNYDTTTILVTKRANGTYKYDLSPN